MLGNLFMKQIQISLDGFNIQQRTGFQGLRDIRWLWVEWNDKKDFKTWLSFNKYIYIHTFLNSWLYCVQLYILFFPNNELIY